jgi:hypothetical protein
MAILSKWSIDTVQSPSFGTGDVFRRNRNKILNAHKQQNAQSSQSDREKNPKI